MSVEFVEYNYMDGYGLCCTGSTVLIQYYKSVVTKVSLTVWN